MRTMPLIPALVSILFCAACMDADGNRITLQQWWKNRFATGSGSSMDSPERPPSEPVVVMGPPAEETDSKGGESAEGAGISRSSFDRSDGSDSRPPVGAIRSDALLINHEVITVKDILDPIRPRIEELSKTLPPTEYYENVIALIEQQLKDSVAQRLIYRRARETINDQIEPRIEKAVEQMERERINREFHGLETRYAQYLQNQNKTRKEIRERLRRAVVVESYLRERLIPMIAAPRKRELMRYYQAHHAEFSRPERREMFLIDIPTVAFVDWAAPRTPEAEAQAEREALGSIESAADELAAGKPFEEVAQRYSKGPHAADGGAWGFISSPMTGPWRKPYERFMVMNEGEISEIVEVDHEVASGFTLKRFFIVKVGRVEHGMVTSFKDAQPQIVAELKNRQFQKLKFEFLRKEFEQSTIGDLKTFIPTILQAIPRPTVLDGPVAGAGVQPRSQSGD